MNIVFIDTETTGTDIVLDRIVQIGAIKVGPNCEVLEGEEVKDVILNPGCDKDGRQIKISAEATEVHGITDEMVENAPTFDRIAINLNNYLSGCVIAAYNGSRFDVPLIAEEFARVGIKWPAPGTIILDPYQIVMKKHPRDLSTMYKHYTGKDLEGAHDAKNDILATVELFAAQMEQHEDLKAMTAQEIGEFCQGEEKWVDLAGKIVLKDGVPVYGFGKDKGKSIKDNPGFASWMLKNSFPAETKEQINKILGYGRK